MGTTFKQFLVESRGFDKVETVMELFEDEIKFVRKTKHYYEYEMTDQYWKSFTDEKLKKLQSYFGDDVFVYYFDKTGMLRFIKCEKALIVGQKTDIMKLEDHDEFLADTIKYVEEQNLKMDNSTLYCDRGVADRLNVTDEILFLVETGESAGYLVLSGATSWNSSGTISHMLLYRQYNSVKVGDTVFLFFDEDEDDRIKRFKYLGTK